VWIYFLLTYCVFIPQAHRSVSVGCQLRYITLQTIYSGLSESNFKDHYGDAATQ